MDIKEKEALLCSKYDNINRLLIIQNVDKQDREDVLHDIFINALRSLHKLREPDKMDAWLWKIARNEINRYWRRVIRKRGLVHSLDTEDFEAQMPHVDDAHYRRLEEELDRIVDRDELRRALNRLSRETLILFRLYYFEGYKLREISQITGEKENTLKSRHARGLARLRKYLIKVRVEKKPSEEEILEEVLKRRGFMLKGRNDF